MTYSFRNSGVCSQEMWVEVDDQGIIQSLRVQGGCHGNLQGIAALVQGMPAREAIRRLKGIRCKERPTSCPDQFARNLEALLDKEAAAGQKAETKEGL